MVDRAGLESSLRCHDLRHTHASLIINNGGSLFDVQSALAHANSSISERYAHLSEETRQKTSYNISTVITGASTVHKWNPVVALLLGGRCKLGCFIAQRGGLMARASFINRDI